MDAGDKPTGMYLRRVSDWLSARHCGPRHVPLILKHASLKQHLRNIMVRKQPASNPELSERIRNLPKNPSNPRVLCLKLEHRLLQLIVAFARWRR